jgi:hypothetical protein
MWKHIAAILVTLANAAVAAEGAIPKQYAWIAPSVAAILYAVAGVRNPSQPTNNKP